MVDISDRINMRHISLEDLDRRDGFESDNDRGHGQNEGERPLPIVDAASLAGRPVPMRDWHAEGLIPARNVTLVNGDGGTGKSLLTLMLGTSTVTDMPWLGIPVKQGPCLFLTAEDDLDEVHRRLEDIAADMKIGMEKLAGLKILALAGEDAILAAPEGSGNIIKATERFHQVEKLILDIRPVLVVLDTLADLFGGEENQRAQARQFIALLRGLALRHKTTIVLLAHPSLAGMSSGTGSSGSTAWNNSVRSRLYFERVRDKDGGEFDPDARVLRTMKANYGPTGAEIKVRWRGGVFTTEGSSDESLGVMAGRAKADRVFLDMLSVYLGEGRNVSPAGPNFAPAVFARDSRAEGVSKRGLSEALNRLLQRGKVKIEEYGATSRRAQRVILVANGGDN